MPERPLHPNSRHHDIEADPDVRRWVLNLEQRSGNSAEVQRNCLARFVKAVGLTPKSYLRLPKKQRADVLQDFVLQESARGLAGGYVKGYVVAAKSWLRHNGLELGRRINIRGIDVKTRSADAKIPSPEELAETIRLAGPHVGLRVAILATSGVRPEVLGYRRGRDGLMVKDIPELRIARGEATWDRVPAKVNVRAQISKTGKAYFTFLGPLACAAIKKDLELRMAKGEALGPSSAIVSPTIQTGRPFLCTGNVTKQVRDAMRKAGLKEAPYIWRSYFSHQCLSAKMTYEWREYIMGHKGGIAAVYSMGKRISDEMVEKMRHEYEKACKHLEPGSLAKQENSTLEFANFCLKAAGFADDEVQELNLRDLRQDEIMQLMQQRVFAAKPEPAKPTQRQKSITAEELDAALAAGYSVKMQLQDGRILVESA